MIRNLNLISIYSVSFCRRCSVALSMADDKNQISVNEDQSTSDQNKRSGSSQQGSKSSRRNSGKHPYRGGSKRSDYSQDDSISQRNANFSLSTFNRSTGLITTKSYNSSVVSKSFTSVKDETLVLKMTVKPIKEKLEAQAQVFARKIISLDELYLKAILNSDDAPSRKWINILTNSYIYSFYKCLLYAIYHQKTAECPENSSVLLGHLIMYEALKKPSYTFENDDYTVSYQFRFTEEECKAIKDQALKYDFIKNYMDTSPRLFIENEKLDRVLNGLRREHSPGHPIITRFCDSSEHVLKHLTRDNYPLANSMYTSKSKENTNKWFFCYSEGDSVLDSTTLFGKAMFVTALDDAVAGKYFDLNSDDDNNYLIKYETACLHGSSYPNFKKPVKE